MALIDLTGQKFSRLTVIDRYIDTDHHFKDRHARWNCQCECGNKTIVCGKDLREGKVKSCGCFQKEQTSKANGSQLIGKRFGKLVVIKQEVSKNNRTMWLCQCDCGNKCVVCARDLLTGDTCSCGCYNSNGETLIAKYLDAHNIQYKREYQFTDLFVVQGFPLRFDFAIFNEDQLIGLIEFDGIQHFKISGWNTPERFQRTQYRDQLKNDYCKQHNIKLYRISYQELLNIEERIEKCIADMFVE